MRWDGCVRGKDRSAVHGAKEAKEAIGEKNREQTRKHVLTREVRVFHAMVELLRALLVFPKVEWVDLLLLKRHGYFHVIACTPYGLDRFDP